MNIPTFIIGVQGKPVRVPSQFLGDLRAKVNSNVSNINVSARSYGDAMKESTDNSIGTPHIHGVSLPVAEGIFHILSENSSSSVPIHAEDIHEIYVNAGCHSVTIGHIRSMLSSAFRVYENGGITDAREMKRPVGRLFVSEDMRREKIRVAGHHLTYGYRFVGKK